LIPQYTFQLSLTNPLYDPIQFRLTHPHPPKNAPSLNHHLHIPTQHFTVAAMKDAWVYDEEDDEDDPMLGFEGPEEASEGSNLGQRSRLSVLGPSTAREKK